MTDQAPAPSTDASASTDAKGAGSPRKQETWLDTVKFIVWLVLIVVVVRSFIFSPFNIPSQSMLPRLLIGDYLFVSKFNYGYSRYSLPITLGFIPTVHWADPSRGDVVVFKAPSDHKDWIKRVIGLPGDTVQMQHGQLILNGKAIPKERIDDFVVPITPNFPAESAADRGECPSMFLTVDAQQHQICKIPRFRETLPGGKTYDVLDMGQTPADDTDVFTVPAGHVFLMGDNRDNSQDSRFPVYTGGISYVPMENLEGKAVVSFWSTDGSANWFLPWTWFTAARWSRIGHGF
jgi:signal peptidase I